MKNSLSVLTVVIAMGVLPTPQAWASKPWHDYSTYDACDTIRKWNDELSPESHIIPIADCREVLRDPNNPEMPEIWSVGACLAKIVSRENRTYFTMFGFYDEGDASTGIVRFDYPSVGPGKWELTVPEGKSKAGGDKAKTSSSDVLLTIETKSDSNCPIEEKTTYDFLSKTLTIETNIKNFLGKRRIIKKFGCQAP